MPCCLLVSLLLVHLADICTTLVRCLDGMDVGLLDDRRSNAAATPAAFPADSRARRRDGFVMLCQGVSDSCGDVVQGCWSGFGLVFVVRVVMRLFGCVVTSVREAAHDTCRTMHRRVRRSFTQSRRQCDTEPTVC